MYALVGLIEVCEYRHALRHSKSCAVLHAHCIYKHSTDVDVDLRCSVQSGLGKSTLIWICALVGSHIVGLNSTIASVLHRNSQLLYCPRWKWAAVRVILAVSNWHRYIFGNEHAIGRGSIIKAKEKSAIIRIQIPLTGYVGLI